MFTSVNELIKRLEFTALKGTAKSQRKEQISIHENGFIEFLHILQYIFVLNYFMI